MWGRRNGHISSTACRNGDKRISQNLEHEELDRPAKELISLNCNSIFLYLSKSLFLYLPFLGLMFCNNIYTYNFVSFLFKL